MTHTPLQQLSLSELVADCRQAQTHEQNPQSCFELFRRAIDERDDQAWQAIEKQFHRLEIHWVRQMASFEIDGQEIEDVLANAHEFFWRYVRVPITTYFPHLGALLKYLKDCVRTAVNQLKREQEQQQLLAKAMQQEVGLTGQESVMIEYRLAETTFWACVRELVRTHITDEEGRLVLYWHFELGLKPADVAKQLPDHFPTARSVSDRIELVKRKLVRVFQLYLHERCM